MLNMHLVIDSAICKISSGSANTAIVATFGIDGYGALASYHYITLIGPITGVFIT